MCPLVALSVATVSPFHAVKKVALYEAEELIFWCSLIGANRPLKEAMQVAIACLQQEDLGFGVLRWERK